MKFETLRNHNSNFIPALEANTIDIEGESMNISLITDKIIEDNNLPEVTNPIMFKDGYVPTDDGLFSTVIFGESGDERKRNHAYIDLKRKFFHPYIFEVLKKLDNKIDKVASGQGFWYIDEQGQLIQINDPEDRRYNEDNTGIDWLVKNFRKIKFKETDTKTRNVRLKLLNSLTDDEIFISKWIVIPILYRDIGPGEKNRKIPDIDNMYNSLIVDTRAVDNEVLNSSKVLTLYRIQKKLCQIREVGQGFIEKKNGAFQKSILGKAPDHGARGVISVPSLNGCEVPNDCLVDIIHSGIPLSYCLVIGLPFMIKWVSEFFEDLFRNRNKIPIINDKTKEIEYVEVPDQTEIYTTEFIKKKFKMFQKTYGAERIEPIYITDINGKQHKMRFIGQGYGNKPDNPNASDISNRYMTWTDVIYLAAVETLSDKYCYITRYPLEDYFGTFPSKVSVLSTIKTEPVMINGKVYPFYPKIDTNWTPSEAATKFIDTISFSNLYLDAIGGDYDGDTVSIKMCFSIEANEEAAKMLEDIKHYVSIQGNLVRVLGNETFLTFYNMTRRE